MGEAVAMAYLELHGFTVIKTNERNKHGEIDIIATNKDKKSNIIYHFIEVKMRSGSNYGYGREAVDSAKQKRIRGAAQFYLIEKQLYDKVFCCFDVLELSGGLNNYEIEFLENCF